ncbi:hypothetical protein OCEANICA350_12666 [Oceanicaulis sp. 350]|nr:hypothetical protein OCEANICA350_12666 [Oceanicaulis sp. 350]
MTPMDTGRRSCLTSDILSPKETADAFGYRLPHRLPSVFNRSGAKRGPDATARRAHAWRGAAGGRRRCGRRRAGRADDACVQSLCLRTRARDP